MGKGRCGVGRGADCPHCSGRAGIPRDPKHPPPPRGPPFPASRLPAPLYRAPRGFGVPGADRRQRRGSVFGRNKRCGKGFSKGIIVSAPGERRDGWRETAPGGFLPPDPAYSRGFGRERCGARRFSSGVGWGEEDEEPLPPVPAVPLNPFFPVLSSPRQGRRRNTTRPSKVPSTTGKRRRSGGAGRGGAAVAVPQRRSSPPPPPPGRGCTDIICCVLLVIAIVGYVVVGVVGTYPRRGDRPPSGRPRRQNPVPSGGGGASSSSSSSSPRGRWR